MSARFIEPLGFAVVTANQHAYNGAVNLANNYPALVWRSNNLTAISLIVDLGADARYDSVSLIGSNLRITDTVQVRTGTTSTFSSS